ncbi:hypothetical protein HL653_20985 [Sphingomonas sp. AP4-R1]|uniref:hypothetical protein n=1 Tax=Sphingomonas sp. AP4-R1 TaxID=2735134 RepID=UPI001493D079|nr:hypothetical protein [Sphingomonas sp. AP4-R1]QJU59888.1 hypothetical protein HL653_20985 [Sphingomonas sp. AP4-R1]
MMTGLDRLSSATPLGLAAASREQDARAIAGQTIGEIGHRVLAWVGASGGALSAAGGSAAWALATGEGSGFRPDVGELARGGDIYDLDGLARDVAGRVGATPIQEGELRRAFADFTRAAVVQVAGLAGATGERQMAGIQSALDEAVSGASPGGADGVIERIERASAILTAANGN